MKTVRVLFVEDHLEWQSILLRYIDQALKEINCHGDIRLQTDFNEALELLQKENWDLLISDVGLGGEKISNQLLGKQLAAVARDEGIPCILISGTIWVNPHEAKEFFKNYQVYDFFWRPSFNDRSFITSVCEAIQNKMIRGDKLEEVNVEIPDREDRYALRSWWHTVLFKEGRYDCYAIFLGSPGDKDLVDYLVEYQSDLELIARDNWLIISLSKNSFKNLGVYKPLSLFIKDDIENGSSIKTADVFKVEKDKLPCLVVFKDIRSTDNVVVLLAGKSAKEIFETLKTVISVIQLALSKGADPIDALKFHQKKTKMKEVLAGAGISLERIMENLIAVLPKILGS